MALHALPYAVERYNALSELRMANDQFESA